MHNVKKNKQYLRLKSMLDEATDPRSKRVARKRMLQRDVLGPSFFVIVKTRQFRTSPKLHAFLAFGIDGQILRFHPFEAREGIHKLRISRTLGLAYLSELATGRTWVFTLEPFRAARHDKREASAIAIAAPYADLETARVCAPHLVEIASWLKAPDIESPVLNTIDKPLPVLLSGSVVAGTRIIDPVTGRQLITLRSQSLTAGPALLKVQQDALRITQNSTEVFFPIQNVLNRLGNQLTRSALYKSVAQASQRSAELENRHIMGELLEQALSLTSEPNLSFLTTLDTFNAINETVFSDHRGCISMVLTLPKKLGGSKRIVFRLKDFGAREKFKPSLWWVPHQGIMILWIAAQGTVSAFGISPRGVRRFGLFQSLDDAKNTAMLNAAALLEQAFVSRRALELDDDSSKDLLHKVAQFNGANKILRAESGYVTVANVFTGAVLRFQTSIFRGIWSLKILLSPAGPLWVMFSPASARNPKWLVYGPIKKSRLQVQTIEPCAQGRGSLLLNNLANLLTKKLSIQITVVNSKIGDSITLDDVHQAVNRAIGPKYNFLSNELNQQSGYFYSLADTLKHSLLSQCYETRRNALVAADFIYFDKPAEHLLNIHRTLFTLDLKELSLAFSDGGQYDTRVKEMIRLLGSFTFARIAHSVPLTMKNRFLSFLRSTAILKELSHR